jgi:hypothetical protein
MMASHRWEAAGCLSRRELRGAIPGQELVDPIDRMIGYVGQHMAQPGLGVNTAQLDRADQRVDDGGTLAATVGTGEQVVAAANRDPAQRSLGGRVVDLDDAVVAVAQQRWPQVQCVVDRRRCVRLARQFFKCGT